MTVDVASLRLKEALSLLECVEGIFANCEVTHGACCCGDNMKNHSDPMSAGHSPVDQGEYAVSQFGETLKAFRAKLAADKLSGV